MRSHTTNKLLKSQETKAYSFGIQREDTVIFKKKEPTGYTLCSKVLRKVDMVGQPGLFRLTKDLGNKNFQTQLSTLLEFQSP